MEIHQACLTLVTAYTLAAPVVAVVDFRNDRAQYHSEHATRKNVPITIGTKITTNFQNSEDSVKRPSSAFTRFEQNTDFVKVSLKRKGLTK